MGWGDGGCDLDEGIKLVQRRRQGGQGGQGGEAGEAGREPETELGPLSWPAGVATGLLNYDADAAARGCGRYWHTFEYVI